LEVTTSSTALEALSDAVLYLVAYPYECSEQLSSRILAMAALKDVLAAFDARGLPPPEELARAVERDVAALRTRQNDDGGFAMWERGDPSWPYGTIHVVHALLRAKEKGYAVPPELLEKSKPFLAGIEGRKGHAEEEPAVQHSLVAYALNVRKRLGDPDLPRARRLVDEKLGALPLEAAGWLLSVLSG